jgi:uncharacterized membrane protein
MRTTLAIGLFLVVLGIVGMCLSVILGSVSVALVILVPVIMFDGILPVLSMFSFIAGLVAIASQWIVKGKSSRAGKDEETWGGVVLIGPFPILFGAMKGAIPLHIRVLLIAVFSIVIAMMLLVVLALSL